MIPPLRIQLLTGAQSGLQTTHTDPRLTFGRETGLSIVIDEAHLSRQHGELVCIEGQWAVINRSANGTTVNGKRIKGEQPRILKPGDVIGVGKTRLFAVQYAPGSDQPVAEFDTPEPEAEADAGNKMSRRGKLWLGVGVYLFLSLLVFIFIITFGGDDDGGGKDIPAELTKSQIAQVIETGYTRPRDEAKALQHLEQAREIYQRTGASKRATYDALDNYRLALAFSKADTFEDQGDVIAFAHLKQQLRDELTDAYQDAYAMVRDRQWGNAEKKLREIQQTFPDHDSLLFKNVDKHLSYVLSSRSRR